jgi:hypothetical protein
MACIATVCHLGFSAVVVVGWNILVELLVLRSPHHMSFEAVAMIKVLDTPYLSASEDVAWETMGMMACHPMNTCRRFHHCRRQVVHDSS